MKKQKKTVLAVFAILGIAIIGLAAGVVAKYLSSVTGTGSATVAKWAFSTDNTGGTITCQLDQTYDPATLKAGKIAPGTSGKCPFLISNANSEVGVEFTIVPNSITNKPVNLVFYKDAAHTVSFNAANPITDTLAPGTTMDTPVYVYWEWPYETAGGNEDDTDAGESSNTMTITFDITGTQVRPTAQ